MHAIVRRITLPPDLSENDARDLDHFRRVHESRPGFIGALEIEQDGGRRLLVNLWESREAAEAGRRTVAPLAAAHVVPHATEPPELVAVGPVRTGLAIRARS